MASDRQSMAEAKVSPMGLQCDKLQREDLHHYRQPLQERRRCHGKPDNVPTTDQYKESGLTKAEIMSKKDIE